MNFTTGSKTGPPPWSLPMSVNTNDPDSSTSDPYVSGDRYAADSAATPPNDEPSRHRPARCADQRERRLQFRQQLLGEEPGVRGGVRRTRPAGRRGG